MNTAELAARLAACVGASLPVEVEPHVEYATIDTVRHFARAYGDDNPLFTNPQYARTSVRRELIAPPLFPLATGSPTSTGAHVSGVAVAALGEVRQLSVQVSEDRWTLHRPVTLGTRLERTDSLGAVSHDEALGAIFVTTHSRYAAAGSLFAEHLRVRRFGGPPPAREPSRSTSRYTVEDIERIDAAYASETRRGASTRVTDEIAPGDTLDRVVRGPLTITDLIEYRAGVGRGPFGAGALRLAHMNRRRLPSFYDRDERGGFDARERCHWDTEYARSLGHPNAYDYSHTRLTWLSQLVTDWIGDGGWLRSIRFRERAANYVGDTHWLTGSVTSVATLSPGDAAAVRLSLRATNQHGVDTCMAEATALSPTRLSAAVELPLADAQQHERVDRP